MSMTELVTIIETNGKGVRAYQDCAQTARDRVKARSEEAAAYLLLAMAAETFVDAYDDQPLLSQNAENEFLRFKNYVEQLESIEKNSDGATKLDALNRVAAAIASHK